MDDMDEEELSQCESGSGSGSGDSMYEYENLGVDMQHEGGQQGGRVMGYSGERMY